MKPLALTLLLVAGVAEADSKRPTNTIILDETRVQNLGITLAEAEEAVFEETIFALGHIDVLPGRRAVVSSRIPGRAASVLALPYQQVDSGQELLWVESRQPGDPPPIVKLAAPMSGLVAKVEIAQGQPVSPDQSLIEIIDLQSVQAVAQVPQHLAGKLRPGQAARIRVSALPDRIFMAVLKNLGAYADEESGTVDAVFHVENPDQLLRPGMRAEFSIITRKREDVMSVPREALQGDPGGRHVYVADYELKHAFVKVAVQTGEQNDSRVEIVRGLLPGDEVVVRGAYMLGFAGQGSLSLKEALDAAHGHAHNEDGSEMSAEQKAAAAGQPGAASGGAGGGLHPLTTFFAATSALLLVLLVTSLLLRKRAAA